jgi:hypothetical protein
MSRRLKRLKQFLERRAPLRSDWLLPAAAVLHVALCVALALIGRFNLLPGMLDANGISSPLALDSFYYRRKSMQLVAALAQGNITDWLYAPFPLHAKFYSLSFAVLSPLFGFTMLSAEPLNLFYYLTTVMLVFKLGEETFDRRAGVLAAVTVALWPSFLLHTTQLLRDPLFIVASLSLVLIGARWLTKNHSLRRALLEALLGAAASALILITRYNIWPMIFVFTLLGAVLLVIRWRREKRLPAANMAGAALLLLMMCFTPFVIRTYLKTDSSLLDPEVAGQPVPPSPCPNDPPESAFTARQQQQAAGSRLPAMADGVAARISDFRRRSAVFYADAGSNLDTCVRFGSAADLLRYLPRAVANGFFAPYPNMWFDRGSSTGRAGRLLGGLETLAVYLIELLAVVGLWKGRRLLSAWFIALTAATGIVALSLVIVNVAVLYRMRYVFWMLLIVLGAGGATHLLSRRSGASLKSS